MTATDAQVRMMMDERNKGRTQDRAAAKANVRSRQTVAKYKRVGQLPTEREELRQYWTRADVVAEDWPALETMLRDAPSLEAKALFEWLCEQHPGRYQEGQLRFSHRTRRPRRAGGDDHVAGGGLSVCEVTTSRSLRENRDGLREVTDLQAIRFCPLLATLSRTSERLDALTPGLFPYMACTGT
jgi:hypothetical protein